MMEGTFKVILRQKWSLRLDVLMIICCTRLTVLFYYAMYWSNTSIFEEFFWMLRHHWHYSKCSSVSNSYISINTGDITKLLLLLQNTYVCRVSNYISSYLSASAQVFLQTIKPPASNKSNLQNFVTSAHQAHFGNTTDIWTAMEEVAPVNSQFKNSWSQYCHSNIIYFTDQPWSVLCFQGDIIFPHFACIIRLRDSICLKITFAPSSPPPPPPPPWLTIHIK